MPKLRSILPALALAATLHAQLTPLQDPANLAGERVSPQDPADTLPLNHGAPALQQLLAKLRTRASLMLIVAHPDDEDGGLLTYESRGQGARVAMLTLTRGEGGQNLMSADFDDALGLIRTQELLAADRYFGVDQFFGTEVDFGFSKTKEESFGKWTHDRVLYDAVRAVRLYRPLVIASVFVGGPTDGHGQHQVAGEIAQEVFVAAADPNVFPEMIAQGLLPWAPLKVYARVPFSRVTPEGMYDYATGKTIPTRFHNYVTGEDSTAVPTATVLIHEGDKPSDPTLAAAMGGDTFLQFARKGLALQKTQIGPNARLAAPGAFDAPYTLMASRLGCIDTKAGCPTFATASSSLRWASTKPATEQSLFDGIDTSLAGIASVAPNLTGNYKVVLKTNLIGVDQNVAEAQLRFDPAHLERMADPLQTALVIANSLIKEIETPDKWSLPLDTQQNLLHELRIKRVQLNNALILAHSFTLSATIDGSSQPLLTGSTSALVHVKLGNPQTDKITILPEVLGQSQTVPTSNTVFSGILFSQNQTVSLTAGTPTTRPYFSRPNPQQPFYDIANPALRNAPATPSPLVVKELLDDNGARLQMQAVVSSEPQLQTAAVVLVPRLSLGVSPGIGIASVIHGEKVSFTFDISVRTNTLSLREPRIELDWPQTWHISVPKDDFRLTSIYDTHTLPVHLTVPTADAKGLLDNPQTIRAYVVDPVLGDISQGYRPVGYPGLPYTNFYTPATYRATAVDLRTAPNLRIAYLPGTGDPVPDFLPNLGITPTTLTLKDLTATTLNKYDAILVGVRAYAAHPELAGPGSQPLLDYAKQGGVVILQYNTARYGDAEAPFPIAVPGDSAHNVVEEAQPVTLLQPDAPLLTWPNKITAVDFDHWVAERGHGFAASWSPQYQPLLETHDVGQDPQQGGLLLARTGKGAYIYCALALYRQLPEGVPGAYRLLANLLSYAKNPQVSR